MLIQSSFCSGHRRILAAAFFLLSALFFGIVPAIFSQSADNGPNLAIEAGYDGYYKSGDWLPVTITASNTGQSIEGAFRTAGGNTLWGNETIYTTPVTLPTNSSKRVKMLIMPPQQQGGLTIELVDRNGSPISQATSDRLNPLAENTLLYGIASSEPGAFLFLENVLAQRDEAAVAFLDLEDLPENQLALSSFDILIFDGVDSGRLGTPQIAALKGWVEAGGQLVVTGGPDWQQATSVFTDLLPVTISGTRTADALAGLQDWATIPFPDPGPYLVSDGLLRQGESLIAEGDIPILSRRPFGLGGIYFLALDPKLAPLANWAGHELIWAEIAKRTPNRLPWDGGFQNSYNTSTAISNIPGIKLPSIIFVLTFLLIYVVVIGPANYLILKRMNRLELAWISIPLGVMLFCGAAYFLGRQFTGQDIVVNQLNLVTGHVDAEEMRVQTVFGVYSPRRANFNLTLPAGAAVRPADQFGSDSADVSPLVTMSPTQAIEINGIQANAGDLSAYEVESYQSGPSLLANIQLQTEQDQLSLHVDIANDSTINLENVALLLGNVAVPLGDLQAGHNFTQSEFLGTWRQDSVNAPFLSPGMNFNSPLVANSEILLGAATEETNLTKWQLLQAVDGGSSWEPNHFTGSERLISLIAWSNEVPVEPQFNDEVDLQSTTLYIWQVPLNGDQELLEQFMRENSGQGN